MCSPMDRFRALTTCSSDLRNFLQRKEQQHEHSSDDASTERIGAFQGLRTEDYACLRRAARTGMEGVDRSCDADAMDGAKGLHHHRTRYAEDARRALAAHDGGFCAGNGRFSAVEAAWHSPRSKAARALGVHVCMGCAERHRIEQHGL